MNGLDDFDAVLHRQLCLEAERARQVAESTSYVARVTHDRWIEAERKAEGYRLRRSVPVEAEAISMVFV